MIVNGSRCYYCLSSASFSALLKLPLLLLLLSSSQIGYVVMANSSRTTGSSSNAVTDDASSGYNTIKTTTSPNNTNAIVRFYFIRHGESGAVSFVFLRFFIWIMKSFVLSTDWNQIYLCRHILLVCAPCLAG